MRFLQLIFMMLLCSCFSKSAKIDSLPADFRSQLKSLEDQRMYMLIRVINPKAIEKLAVMPYASLGDRAFVVDMSNFVRCDTVEVWANYLPYTIALANWDLIFFARVNLFEQAHAVRNVNVTYEELDYSRTYSMSYSELELGYGVNYYTPPEGFYIHFKLENIRHEARCGKYEPR